jgi:chitin disaccharide deacetylase
MDRTVIITADDLGLDHEINTGIIESFEKGIITCASLLMNAPSTEDGIKIAKHNPNLEVGIHLSIVEGYSLRGVRSTITDESDYFSDGICLIRDWKKFLVSYFTGRINFVELEEELELQILKFKAKVGEIPFLNSTQHLHLLPVVWKIVFKLCIKYDIKVVRLPRFSLTDIFWHNRKILRLIPFLILGTVCRTNLRDSDIKCPGNLIGIQYSGNINISRLLYILKHLNHSITEIILHPGYHSDNLTKCLPDSYSDFYWENELLAAKSSVIKEYISKNNIKIVKFSDL